MGSVYRGVFVGIGIGSIVAGFTEKLKSRDPPDNDYKTRAQPRSPKPPYVKPKAGTPIDADVADAINVLLRNQAEAIGIDRALITSIERAQGAAAANKPRYVKMQMKNARKYASELVQLIVQRADLCKTAADELRSNGAVISISEKQIRKIRHDIIKKGLPQDVYNMIKRYVGKREETDDIANQLVTSLQGIHPQRVSFPDILVNKELAIAEQNIASALQVFSQSIS